MPPPFVILTREVIASPVAVPDVVGEQLTDATTQIEAAGLTVGAVGSTSDAAPVNEVIAQDPVSGTLLMPGSMVNLTISLGATTGEFDDDYDAAEQLVETSFARSWRTADSVATTPYINSNSTYGIDPDFQSDGPAGPRIQFYVPWQTDSNGGNAGTLNMTPTGPILWATFCYYLPAATANMTEYASGMSHKMMRLDMSSKAFKTEGPGTFYGGFGQRSDPGGAGEQDSRVTCRVGGDPDITGGWNDGTAMPDRYRSYTYDSGPNNGRIDNQLSGATACYRDDRIGQGGGGWIHPSCWIIPIDTWCRFVYRADWTNAPNGDVEAWAQVEGEPWYKFLDGRQSQSFPWYWAGAANAKCDEAKCFINMSSHQGDVVHATWEFGFKNFWVGSVQPIGGLP